MKDKNKTKKQLINELEKLGQQVTELEVPSIHCEQVEEELKKLAAFVINNPAPVFQAGYDGNIIGFNPAAKEIFKKDLRGESLYNLFSEFDESSINNLTISKPFKLEQRINEETFLFTIKKDEATGSLYIYGIDITERKRAEEKIEQAADEWETTFNSITDSVSIQDKNFKLVRVNKAFADAFKMKPEELIGKTCYEVIHGTKEPWANCPYKKLMETGKSFTEEFFEPPLGIHLKVSTSPIFDDKGEVVGSVHITKDITERKQADEELIKTKDYLNNIIENSLDCIITTDSKGRINKVNKSFLKMLGCEREEVMGRRTLEFSPADEGTYKSTTGEWVQIKEKFFDDTKTMVSRLVTEGEIYNWESYYSREDKKVVPVEQSIVYLHNDEGDKIGAVGIIRDITERKQAEEEKARIDARLLDKVTELSIMNEISEVLLSTRELNEILHMILIGATANQALGFNRAFLFLINEKENTLEGKVATGSLSVEEDYKIWERLVHERHSLKELIKSRHGELSKEDEPINNLVRQIKLPLKGTESIFSQAVYEKKSFNIINGRQNPLIDRGITNLLEIDALALVPLLSRGKPLGVLLADNFINKKPINDEDVKHLRSFANHASLAIENSHLYRSLEEKVEELSDANNELRENRDKLIRYERLSAVGKVAAQITHEIKNPLVSIGGFARRILKKDQDGGVNRNYAKIIVKEVDHLENILTEILYFAKPAVPKFDTIDLNSIIKSTLEVLHSEIEKNNISIEEHLDFNLPILWIDKNQIKRVLINLVKNAIQAMPDGGTIIVSTINERQWVRVEIADTGVGIPEDDLDKLFDAFFTSKSTGSGLGLAISAQIVNNHGGTIEVHNRIPKGTIFTIKLPVKAPS